MKEGERKRRDWGLLLLFLFLGILLMLLAGQKGTQLLPRWNLRADIGSNLNPNDFQLGPDSRGFQPLRPEILTPPVWNNDFLTPHPEDDANATLPTFVVFDPSSTPSVTPSPTNSPTGTATTVTTTSTQPTTTATTTRTRRPPKDDTPTSTSTSTTTPPPTSAAGTLPTMTPYGSEPDVNATPDGSIYNDPANLPDGYAMWINLGVAIVVSGSPEPNYDLVYYERASGSGIMMDWVQIDVAEILGGPAYTVFHWGDTNADTNSNLDTNDIGGTESDNRPIDDPVDTGILYGTSPLDTGVLIDVDAAPTPPPAGSYQYLLISAPAGAGSGNDGADIDSIQVTEVPP